MDIFPQDIIQAISVYLANPAASSCTDLNLYRALKKYDNKETPTLHVEDLADESLFQMKNGRVFRRMEKVRKRYKCKELATQRIYLFHPLAEIFPVKD
jgi:hypothetical protein